MSDLKIKEKEIVCPGEVLAEGMDYVPGFGTYRDNDKIVSCKLGVARVDGRAIKITPLSGRYMPKKNDVVIGRVFDITFSGWRLNLNTAYSGMLMLKDATSEYIARGADLTQFFNLDDYLVCKITNVTSQKLIDISMKGPGLKKLGKGRLIKVNPKKVPRIIGKQGSMVTIIKNFTKCWIVVGQNGLIWLKGEPESEVLAVEAIKKIEQESHIPGLTDKIKKFFEEKTGKKMEEMVQNPNDNNSNGNENAASNKDEEVANNEGDSQ